LRSSKQDALQAAIQSANALKELENQYSQGIAYFENAQYDKAIEALTQVINRNPNYKDASQKLARAQGLKNQRAQTDDLERTYARGIGYMQNNDWKNAILAFTQVNQSNPDYKDVAFKLEEAKAKFSQSLVAEGYEKLYANGVAAYNEKDWVKAILAFEKVREWNPNFKNIRRMYADAQNQLNQEEQSAVKMRYYSQGKTDLASGDWGAAISSFQQLVRLDSNFRDAQQLLNQARNELQRETEANQLDKLYAEGNNYFDNGDWLKSIIVFEKLQQLKPGYRDVDEKLLLAQNYSNNQNETDIAIDVSPGNAETRNWLGSFIPVGLIISLSLIPLGIVFFMVPSGRVKLLLMQGKYQKAALIYESLLLKKPHKLKLYPELAQIYSFQNRKDETALKVYDISLQQDISTKLKEKLIELTDQKNNNSTKHIEINTLEEQLRLELANLNNKTI
jgi:tetratricopeptide (TPR) repeat protein